MKKPYIIVVVPFKGKCDLVVSCIQSLVYSYISGFAYQFYLIDDSGTDKNKKILESKLGNLINCVYYHNNKRNIGLTRSLYNLIEEVKADDKKQHTHMLIVNNDVVFLTGTFNALVKRALSNPNIANVGCKILDWNQDFIIHTGTRINRKCENWIDNPFVGLHRNDPISNNVERRLWNNGCCSLYNLDILKKENMNFDLDFSPAYFEEADLMTRLNLKGYSVLFEPNAIVRHKMNATVNDEIQKYGVIFERNWKLYLNKWKKHFDSKMLYFQ